MHTIQGWLVLRDKTTSLPLKIPAQTTYNQDQKKFLIELQIPEFKEDGTVQSRPFYGDWISFLNDSSFKKNKHKYQLLGFLAPEKISEFIKTHPISFENFHPQTTEIFNDPNNFLVQLQWAPSILNTSHSQHVNSQKKETFLHSLFEIQLPINSNWLSQNPQFISKPTNETESNKVNSSTEPKEEFQKNENSNELLFKDMIFSIPDELQFEENAASLILTHPKILSFNDLESFSHHHSKITLKDSIEDKTNTRSSNSSSKTKNLNSFSFSILALPAFSHSYPQEDFGLLVCDSFLSPELFELSKPYWKGKYEKKSIFSYSIIKDLIEKNISFSINGLSINSSFIETNETGNFFNYKKLAFELHENKDSTYYNFYLNHLRNFENQQLHLMFDNAPHLSFNDVPQTQTQWIPFYLSKDNSPSCWLHPDGFLCYSNESKNEFNLKNMDQFLMLNDSKFKEKFNRILERAKDATKTPQYFMKTDQHFILQNYDSQLITWKKNNAKKPSN